MAAQTEDGSKEEKIVDELDILTLIHGFDTMLLTLGTWEGNNFISGDDYI